MKKILMTLLVLSVALLLAACGNQDSGSQPEVPQHEHTYATEWSKDANNHWHAASCEHAEEVSEKAAHTWNSGEVTKEATVDAKGEKTYTCTVCGQTKTEEIAKLDPPAHEHAHSTEWSSDENEHWHECECGDKADKAAHEVAETKYENGYKAEVCACGYEMSKVAYLTYVVEANIDPVDVAVADGVYTLTFTTTKNWATIDLYYNGQLLKWDNVTATGDVCSAYATMNGAPNILYWGSDSQVGWVAYDAAGNGGENYTLVYNPADNSLVVDNGIEVVGPDETGLDYLLVQGIDDNSVTVVANDDGTYTLSCVTTSQWGVITLYWNGETLLTENIQTSGAARPNCWYDDLENYLYPDSATAYCLFDFDGQDIPHVFTLTYNPTDSTLVVSVSEITAE